MCQNQDILLVLGGNLEIFTERFIKLTLFGQLLRCFDEFFFVSWIGHENKPRFGG